MGATRYFNCPNCQNPVSIPPLTHLIRFPDDAEPIIALLERRLNVAICQVCRHPMPIIAELLLKNQDKRTILISIPKGGSYDKAQLQKQARNFQLQFYNDYADFYQAVLQWANDYMKSISQILLNPDTFGQLTRQEQIELVSPLVLCILKSQIEGKLPTHLQFSGTGNPDNTQGYLVGLYNAIVADQLMRLLRETARTPAILKLSTLIEEHIPRDCITTQILSMIVKDCQSAQNPYANPNQFMHGFLQEYLNAVAHAYAHTANPRGKDWARYLLSVWKLSKDERVTLDPQYLLSPEVVRRTLRFEDLWDAKIAGLRQPDMTEQNLNDMIEMMKSYGFEKELTQTMGGHWFWFEITDDPENLQALLKSLQEQLFERVQFNQSPEESEELGALVGRAVQFLLDNSYRNEAVRFVNDLIGQAIAQGDNIAAIKIAGSSTEELNKFELHREAEQILLQVISLADAKLIRDHPALAVDFWNEVGNAFRYIGNYEEALSAYSLASSIAQLAASERNNTNTFAIINKNRAIVYRDMGLFSQAIDIFQRELEHAPQDHTLQHSLALLYVAINRYEEALRYMNQALDLVPGHINAYTRSNYLITRARIQQAAGNMESGLQDLIAAFTLLPKDEFSKKSRIASIALGFHPQTEDGQNFVAMCQQFIIDALQSKRYRQSPDLLLAALVTLGTRLLKNGAVQLARDLIEPEWQSLQGTGNMPWQFDHVMGQLYYALADYEQCRSFIQSALLKLNQEVPAAGDAAFAPFWIRDKELFQTSLATITLFLVEHSLLPAEELLTVFEFMNGREISARLGQENSQEIAGNVILDHYIQCSHKIGREIATFFFVETDDALKLVHVSSSQGTVSILHALQLTEVKHMKRLAGEALKWANPCDLSFLDLELTLWEEISRQLGAKIAPLLTRNQHVCFLPGRACTGLPLHLIKLPDEAHLIEHHTTTYAPNFAMLLAQERPNPSSSKKTITVVVAPKDKDSVDFKRHAVAAAEQLLASLAKDYTGQLLKEQAADSTAIFQALDTSTEVVFICHGTTAGPERGYGICIASEGNLPPSLLPVVEVPELNQFILSWQDIGSLKHTPEIVVSVACSTGITEVTSGGVRIGLEQTLFGSGTQVIISPLWDVDQMSSIVWVEQFYQQRSDHPEWAIDEVFQSACLALRKQYPHPYFWGPFIYNGSLFTNRHDK